MEEGRTAIPESASRVKSLRLKLGLTQEQLAEPTRLDRSEISQIEIGRNHATSARIRQELAAGFGLSLEVTFLFLDGAIDVETAAGRSTRRPA